MHTRDQLLALARTQPKTFLGLLLELEAQLQDTNAASLAVLHQPQVPFTKGQAHQHIPMVKVKQKIPACFRILHGTQVFARIRSCFWTMRKQAHDLLEAITGALLGHPIRPNAPWESGLLNSHQCKLNSTQNYYDTNIT